MAWEICWGDICRACMESAIDLLPLYNEEDATGDANIAEKLAVLSNIEVSFDVMRYYCFKFADVYLLKLCFSYNFR